MKPDRACRSLRLGRNDSDLLPTALAELSGCHTGGRSKCPGEGTVIVETASMGDLGHRFLTLLQPSGGGRQPGVGNQLARSGPEESLDETSKADGRYARPGCEGSRTQVLILVCL